ncbi:MAG TPA: hypothetical protein VGT60_08390 [Candidatus Limnocylindria bacterium]|nr:hypothetical protein [Candidatus Limnocylindria bacterium]
MTPVAVPAESNTVRAEEERLRGMLEERLGIRTRVASLPGTRALLVSPLAGGMPKGLVVDRSVSAAERISLYVHLAAHIALKHDLPLITIVESRGDVTSGDEHNHRDADRLARAMWWGTSARADGRELWPGRRSRILRPLLSSRPGRIGLRVLLLVLRRLYYAARARRLLEGTAVARSLRDALCVTAVVCAAPELGAIRRYSGSG